MTVTQVMNVIYDEDRLSIQEQNELEDFCFYLSDLLRNKINQMGLHIVSDGCGCAVTKFTQKELANMKTYK